MSPIEITNLTIRPKVSVSYHNGSRYEVHYFYANLVFKLTEHCDEYLYGYLKNSQEEFVKRRIHRTYEGISEPYSFAVRDEDSLEQMLERLREERPDDFYLDGWDFNENHGWFLYNKKFDCWRFHEFFSDNSITRSLFQHIQDLAYNVPTYSRSTIESDLINCFECLKRWWD